MRTENQRPATLPWHAKAVRSTLAGILAAGLLHGCGEEADGERGWPISLGSANAVERPYERVVFVTIDTLRPDHMSSYGYARETTPFLDRLAAEGARFTHALSSISHTAPAHATMLTGLLPSTHGLVLNGMQLDPRAVGLAQLFDTAGYETAAFYNVRFLGAVSSGFDTAVAAPNEGHVVMEAATDWLEGERESDRFFLWLHLYDPHHWNQKHLTPEAEIAEIRERDDWTGEDLYAYTAKLHGIEDVVPEEPQEQLVTWLESYDAHILRADRLLEAFQSKLEELDLADDTLWVVTSDHGEGLGAHGYAGHTGKIYNEQLRIPLIVYAADNAFAGRVIDDLVQQVDFLPTFADLVNIELEGLDSSWDGRSFLPLLAEQGQREDELYSFSERAVLRDKGPLRGIQTKRHKLLVHADGRMEFYDLLNDPFESTDLGDTPERAALLARFEAGFATQKARALPQLDTGDVPLEWQEELKALGY